MRFAVKLIAMKRIPLRQASILMHGLLLALGMSLSVVQASAMTADSAMTMSTQQMSGSSMGDCGSCKDIPGGAKSMVCDAACAAAVVAIVPYIAVPVVQLPMDRPLFQSPMLSGWTASPNPPPPKHVALI
jgi:hypothetical protein